MGKIKWTEEEIEYLKKTYPENESLGCVLLHKKYTLKSISAKARRIGLKSKKFNKWSKNEDEILKEAWRHDSMSELLKKFPNRTYDSLMLRANKFLHIKSEINRNRIGSLNFLDSINKKSSYWWGFIMADGTLSENNGLYILLSCVDELHLKKLSKILGCNMHKRTVINNYTKKLSDVIYLTISDKKFSIKWLNILKIHSPKTYTAPDLSIFMTKEALLSFFIGLIDGDGCIWESRNWIQLRIELHINWFDTLFLISNKLKEFYDIDSKVKITKRGTSKIEINTKKDLRILFSNLDGLDYLERKWNKLINY